MKEELLKIAQESLSDDEVAEIAKEKFKKAFGDVIERAFSWGKAREVLEKKVEEVMVPYIEKYDFSTYLPKLDSVLTEIINADACIGNKKILENFRNLMLEPESKSIKLTDLFHAWIKKCEKAIDTDDLEIDYDDGVLYCPIECEMRFEEQDKPLWSSFGRAVIIFENEHDEKLNIEIPVSCWEWDSGKIEPWTLSVSNDVRISSLRRLDDFQILLLRLERAGTEIIIDKEYDENCIRPEKEPEVTFS